MNINAIVATAPLVDRRQKAHTADYHQRIRSGTLWRAGYEASRMNDSTIKTTNDVPAAMQSLPPRTKEDGAQVDGKTTAAARAQTAAEPSAPKAGILKSFHAPSASPRSAVSGLPNAKQNLEKTVPNRLPTEPDSTASASQLAISTNSALPIQAPARPIRRGFAAPFQADAPVAPLPIETDAAVNDFWAEFFVQLDKLERCLATWHTPSRRRA